MRISDWSSDVCSSDLEIGAFLEPWLGAATFDPELPLPALIDVSFDGASSDGVGRVRAILGRVAPHARIDEQSAWLQPLSGLLDPLRLLGVGIVLLVEIGRALCRERVCQSV